MGISRSWDGLENGSNSIGHCFVPYFARKVVLCETDREVWPKWQLNKKKNEHSLKQNLASGDHCRR
jgi:hypothetical protein